MCCAAFVVLVMLLRRDRYSLGLPAAYMMMLLLIHVPGAMTQVLTDAFDYNADIIELGIRFTAIGCVCFVGGVYLARFFRPNVRPLYHYVERRDFWMFCLVGGLLVEFALKFLDDLPSLRSAIDRGSMIWTLGALLGLRYALSQRNLMAAFSWGVMSFIYPILILLLGGFLSYGSTALIIIAGGLMVSARSRLKLIIVGCLVVYLGLSVFVNYFEHRTQFREVAWSGASMEDRIVASVGMFSDFQLFDPSNVAQLNTFNVRLNQNYFVGLAALRLQQRQVAYLYGKSFSDGVLALIPRVLWPDKQLYGGSGTIVRDMTGLNLSETTSWGVGNVMEFQINFGMPGVVIGFSILGFMIGWLDYRAAAADNRGDLAKLLLYFLIGVALSQPFGSIIEMTGGAAAAVVAAYIWKWLWALWPARSRRRESRRELTALR